MLAELYIKNLAVIKEIRLELETGLTVLSGGEGAGKSLLVDALCLLLGARATPRVVRTGASSALVEGVFCMPEDDAVLVAILQEAGLEPEPDGGLILSREVQEQGRSIGRVNGRAVPMSCLRELGQRLVDIHGQMEQQSLLSPSWQMDMLDRYGGLVERRSQLEKMVVDLRYKSRELGTTAGDSIERQREVLQYQVAEVERANVCSGEDDALAQERRVLGRAEEVREKCLTAYSTLYGDDCCAFGLISKAAAMLRGMSGVDPSLKSYVEPLEAAITQLEEVARELHRYGDCVQSSPERLREVEERLDLLSRLKTRYGPTLDDVVRFKERTRQELETLDDRERECNRIDKELRRVEGEAGRMAEELSMTRQQCAQKLIELVNRELAELSTPWARFGIRLSQEENSAGLPAWGSRYLFSNLGLDRVEFLATTNPGEPLRPLADIASGGEICRFMLALKSALRRVDPIPTLVFDEIDAGIGGRNAHIVGKKLAMLAEDRQVICITHLPQVASFGQSHYRMVKDTSGVQALTGLERLSEGSREEELAEMLGGAGDASMVATARRLLNRAGES